MKRQLQNEEASKLSNIDRQEMEQSLNYFTKRIAMYSQFIKDDYILEIDELIKISTFERYNLP